MEEMKLGAAEQETLDLVTRRQGVDPTEAVLTGEAGFQAIDQLVQCPLVLISRKGYPTLDLVPAFVRFEDPSCSRAGRRQQEAAARGGQYLVYHQIDKRDHFEPERLGDEGEDVMDRHA